MAPTGDCGAQSLRPVAQTDLQALRALRACDSFWAVQPTLKGGGGNAKCHWGMSNGDWASHMPP